MIVKGVSSARARMLADRAAGLRGQVEATLLGVAECRPWLPPCVIHVHGDRESFSQAVPGAPLAVEGATTIEFLGNAVHRRRIDVIDAGNRGTPPALAHEIAHVVLADHFTDDPPPRWADEGWATLFDSPAKQEAHRTDFLNAAALGRTWRLAELMSLDQEPTEDGRLKVFYGQSAAVVSWLVRRADGPTFLRFLKDAAERGPDQALHRHYRIQSVAHLEEAWLRTQAELRGDTPFSR